MTTSTLLIESSMRLQLFRWLQPLKVFCRWVAEMFGYVIAAAHLDLRHEISNLQVINQSCHYPGTFVALNAIPVCTVDVISQNFEFALTNCIHMQAVPSVDKDLHPSIPIIHFLTNMEYVIDGEKRWQLSDNFCGNLEAQFILLRTKLTLWNIQLKQSLDKIWSSSI